MDLYLHRAGLALGVHSGQELGLVERDHLAGRGGHFVSFAAAFQPVGFTARDRLDDVGDGVAVQDMLADVLQFGGDAGMVGRVLPHRQQLFPTVAGDILGRLAGEGRQGG